MTQRIDNEHRLRLIDAMLSPLNQDALGTSLRELSANLPEGHTLRDELRLLFSDAMSDAFTTQGPIDLVDAVVRGLSSELTMITLGVKGDWPADKGK